MSNNVADAIRDHPEIPSLTVAGVNWIFTNNVSSIINKRLAAVDELLSVGEMCNGEPSFCRFRKNKAAERVGVSDFRRNSAFREAQWQLLSSPYNRYVHVRNEAMWWVKRTSTIYRSHKPWRDVEAQIKCHEPPRKHEWEHVIPIKRMAKDLLLKKAEGSLGREDAVRILFHFLSLVTKEEHETIGCQYRHTHPDRRSVTDLGFRPFLRYAEVLSDMQIISVHDGCRIDLASYTLKDHFGALRSLLPIREIWDALLDPN